jgi:hypothetical protein
MVANRRGNGMAWARDEPYLGEPVTLPTLFVGLLKVSLCAFGGGLGRYRGRT